MLKLKLLLIGILVGFTCRSQIKIDRQHFVDLLSQGKYGDVFREAKEIRKQEYGKCLMIDYFIAKALCGDGYNKQSVLQYAAILKNYKLSDPNRNFITSEMKSCKPGEERVRTASINLDIRDFSNIMAMNLPEAAVRGKMGMIANCNMPPQELTYIKPVNNEELESRLFGIDQGEEAIKKYKSMLTSNYHVNLSGRFILITYGNTVLNNVQIASTSERLEKTYHFFISHYHLRPPDKLLAVYLLPDKNIFRQTAKLVHGIKVPDANIGYSNISDLSLVGISDVTRIGTLCHEMFHLMVRTDIGDVPPWVDEGIACIYETSKWQGDQLVGDVENWRTDVLRGARYEMSGKIPRLSEFIGFNWRQFDGFESNDLCKAAIDYAYGKHLMLYLQEEGKLTDLVASVKNRNEITNDSIVKIQTDIDLFERTLNNNIDTIERKFDKWLEKRFYIKPRNYLQTSGAGSQNLVSAGNNITSSAKLDNGIGINQHALPNNVADFNNQQNRQDNALPNVTSENTVQQMVRQIAVSDTIPNLNNLSQHTTENLNADDVVNQLSIHAKKDFNDKMGDAIAYEYHIEAESKLLDQIGAVYYQRNHASFAEFKNKTYKKSDSRGTHFSFKGYQWGSVESVYVYVIMKDSTKSQVVLKPIVYDN